MKNYIRKIFNAIIKLMNNDTKENQLFKEMNYMNTNKLTESYNVKGVHINKYENITHKEFNDKYRITYEKIKGNKTMDIVEVFDDNNILGLESFLHLVDRSTKYISYIFKINPLPQEYQDYTENGDVDGHKHKVPHVTLTILTYDEDKNYQNVFPVMGKRGESLINPLINLVNAYYNKENNEFICRERIINLLKTNYDCKNYLNKTIY